MSSALKAQLSAPKSAPPVDGVVAGGQIGDVQVGGEASAIVHVRHRLDGGVR